MKQIGQIPSPKGRAKPHWRRYVNDSLLALGGGVLVTSLIAAGHLYPRIPTISLVYLLVVVALASTRGLYAASLASLLAVLAFDYFLVPPLYTFVVSKIEDLLTLSVFLATAVITSQLAWAQRRSAEEARGREREIRLLYEQAQELIYTTQCDLSAFRVQLQSIWYVAVLGALPSPNLTQQIDQLLSTGEQTTLPDDVFTYLNARRARATQIGPWVEGHYRQRKRPKR